jgi:hypothetical protein
MSAASRAKPEESLRRQDRARDWLTALDDFRNWLIRDAAPFGEANVPTRRYSGQVAAASGLMIACPTWVGIIGFRYGSPADL